jgi:hypothetical protein
MSDDESRTDTGTDTGADASTGTSTGTGTDTGSGIPIEGGGEGIELTTGEPNSFEPEEDPDAADR